MVNYLLPVLLHHISGDISQHPANMGCCISSSEELSERLLDQPAEISSAEIYALQCNPPRHIGEIESSGRVRQKDYNNTVVGWVDGLGIAFRNDYNLTKVGWVDLSTGIIYAADYNSTQLGRVDDKGQIFCSDIVVHKSAVDTPIGEIRGKRESHKHAACAFFTLF